MFPFASGLPTPQILLIVLLNFEEASRINEEIAIPGINPVNRISPIDKANQAAESETSAGR